MIEWLAVRWWALFYWVRPYDVGRDALRWRWQKAYQCDQYQLTTRVIARLFGVPEKFLRDRRP